MDRVILFGCGSGAEKVVNSINPEIKIIAYADNDRKKQHKIYKGVQVISPQEINEYDYNYLIIASQYNLAIKEQLLDLGIKEEFIFDFYAYICNKNYIKDMIFSFAKSNEMYEMVATGISYTVTGFREDLMLKKAYKFSFASQDLYYDYNIIKYIFDNYKEKTQHIKYCLIGLSYYSFQYDMSLSNMKNRVKLYYDVLKLKHNLKDDTILENKNTYNEILAKRILKVNKNNSIVIEWGGKVDLSYMDQKDILGRKQAELDCNKNYPDTVQENRDILIDYIKLLKENNIKPIAVIFPASKYYTNNFSTKIEKEFKDILYNLQREYKFQILDYFRDDNYDDTDFVDVSHLSKKGAIKFTNVLNERIEW